MRCRPGFPYSALTRLLFCSADPDVLGSSFATADTLVFAAASFNLRGRTRLTNTTAYRPIHALSVIWHPIGSACERLVHEVYLDAPATAEQSTAIGMCWWLLWLSTRLFVFELVFDLFFYVAHRAVHAPRLTQCQYLMH